jgi:hypothetical protein
MEKILRGSEWRIYQLLYIEHKSEEDVSKALGFKSSEKGQKDGYRRIRKVKSIIIERAKKILQDELASAI